MKLIIEAITKEQIIKNLKSSTFDVEGILDNLELTARTSFRSKYFINPPELVWIYVLKFLTIVKNNSLDPFSYVGEFLAEMSFIIRNKLPVEKDLIQSFLRIKNLNEFNAWVAKYNERRENIRKAIASSVRKQTIAPIFVGKDFEIYHIKTYNDARTIAPPPETKWCVSSSNGEQHLKLYNKSKTNLYALIFLNNDEKYLLTIPDEEEMEKIKALADESLITKTASKYFNKKSMIEHLKSFLLDLKYKLDAMNNIFEKVEKLKPLDHYIQELNKKIKLEIFANLGLITHKFGEAISPYVPLKYIFSFGSHGILNIINNIVIIAIKIFVKNFNNDGLFELINIYKNYLNDSVFTFLKTTDIMSINEIDDFINSFVSSITDQQKVYYEFANKNNSHIDIIPFIEYFENIPHFRKNKDFIMDYLYTKHGSNNLLPEKIKKNIKNAGYNVLSDIFVTNPELSGLFSDLMKTAHKVKEINFEEVSINNELLDFLEFLKKVAFENSPLYTYYFKFLDFSYLKLYTEDFEVFVNKVYEECQSLYDDIWVHEKTIPTFIFVLYNAIYKDLTLLDFDNNKSHYGELQRVLLIAIIKFSLKIIEENPEILKETGIKNKSDETIITMLKSTLVTLSLGGNIN